MTDTTPLPTEQLAERRLGFLQQQIDIENGTHEGVKHLDPDFMEEVKRRMREGFGS